MKTEQDFYQGDELTALQEAHHYYTAILSYFAPYLGTQVIEVGAGMGTFSNYLMTCSQISALTLIEPSDNLFKKLHNRWSCDARVRLVNGYLDAITSYSSSDSVVLINVLEHCEDDESLLQTIHRILKPGGALLLFVPALPFLYGTLDKHFGHFRRYTKSELNLRLQKTGFRVVSLRYFNLPGIVTWLLAGKVLKRKSVEASHVRIYDRWIMSWISRFERAWEPPLGQSLLAVCTK